MGLADVSHQDDAVLFPDRLAIRFECTFNGESEIAETLTGSVHLECGQLITASQKTSELIVIADKNFDGDSLDIKRMFLGRMNAKLDSLVVSKGPFLVVTDFEMEKNLALPDEGSVIRAKGLLAFEPIDWRMGAGETLE